MFYAGSWQGVDSTLVLWLLLSSAYTAPRLFPTFPPSGTGWARSWEGTQPGQLTRTDQRDIPDHMTSAQYKAGRKEEGVGVTVGPPRQPLRVLEPCFLRRPDIACSWEVENKSVFFFFASTHGSLLRFAYIKTAVVLPTRVVLFSYLIFFPFFALLRKKGEGGGSDRATWWVPGI